MDLDSIRFSLCRQRTGGGFAALLFGVILAGTQFAAAQMQPSDMTPEQNAKLDKFVGAWEQPSGSFVYAINGPNKVPPPALPDGLKNVHPYQELEQISSDHLQPWAKAKQEATEWDADDTGAVCKRDGLFRQGLASGFSFTLVRGHGKLVWIGDVDELGFRDIYLSAKHPGDIVPTWNGDSRAHFEGDTLVIDTIGFNDKSFLGSDRQPHTEELHVIEYMKLYDNGQYLQDQVIVDDRRALTSPYTFTRVYKRQSPAGEGGSKTVGPGAPGLSGATEEMCNHYEIGHDPWRRKRETILKEHQEELDAYIKQVTENK